MNYQPQDLAPAAENARQLLLFIKEMNVGFGLEKSFKMSREKLMGNRFLIGIETTETSRNQFLDTCRKMDMPEKFQEDFVDNYPDANLVFFGFEENDGCGIYKVYLEFWEKLKKEIRKRPDRTEPRILHLGFKWDAGDNRRGTIARYTCFPLLPLPGILRRVADIYEGYEEKAPVEVITGMIQLAGTRIVDDSFIYLETSEENNSRKSFDINLYKANLALRDIHPFLSRMREHYSIPAKEFDSLLAPIGRNLLGHFSGGADRQGNDFFTVYYEV